MGCRFLSELPGSGFPYCRYCVKKAVPD